MGGWESSVIFLKVQIFEVLKKMGAVAKEEEPAKRGRGRPAKPDGEKKKYVPSGKPRGRPKGSGKKSKAGKVTKPSSGKGRGRPKKVEAPAEEPAAEEEAAE